jgi:hypothetical protein
LVSNATKVVRIEVRAEVTVEVRRVTYYRVPADATEQEIEDLANVFYAGDWEDSDGTPVTIGINEPEEYEVLIEEDEDDSFPDITLVRDAQGQLVQPAQQLL